MHYQEVFRMSESVPYLSVRFGVGVDFTWMFVILPDGILIGKPFRIIHSDPQSCELAISEIKEAQKMYSLESRCLLKSTGIYHIPLLCFLHGKDFDYAVISSIIIKNGTDTDVRKLYNDKSDSKKAARVGLDASPKVSIVPDDVVIDLHSLACDYYYFKDLQSVIVLKLHAELKVSFPTYLNVFSKVATQTSSKLLEACPPATDMSIAPKDGPVETICSMAHFEETYALARRDAICTVAKDIIAFKRALSSNALRIRLYMKMYREYQAHLDNILGELHQVIGKLEGTPDYGRISFIQTLHGVGFLSAVVSIAEIGSFDLFSLPKKLYVYFGLDPGVNDSGRFYGGKVHMSKRGSSLTRRILHVVATNNLEVGKATKTPVNPVIYDYYTRKCVGKKKSTTVEAVMHKIYNTTFTMLRGDKPFELIAPEEYRERYAAGHPESVNPVI